MPRTVAIVQARTGSTRLPGKVLLDLEGDPMLARQLQRLRRAGRIDDIVIATTTAPGDDPLVELAEAMGVPWYRGSEHDVLARFLGAARQAEADIVVRVTADCPLIDPGVVDTVVAALTGGAAPVDYVSNVITRTYPRGLDVEAFHADTLARLDRMAASRPAREHVTRYLLVERPDLFVTRSVTDEEDNSDLRWTVDEPLDMELVRLIYRGLRLHERPLDYRRLVRAVRSNKSWQELNASVEQKQG